MSPVSQRKTLSGLLCGLLRSLSKAELCVMVSMSGNLALYYLQGRVMHMVHNIKYCEFRVWRGANIFSYFAINCDLYAASWCL